jgi:hypothetical protein
MVTNLIILFISAVCGILLRTVVISRWYLVIVTWAIWWPEGAVSQNYEATGTLCSCLDASLHNCNTSWCTNRCPSLAILGGDGHPAPETH